MEYGGGVGRAAGGTCVELQYLILCSRKESMEDRQREGKTITLQGGGHTGQHELSTQDTRPRQRAPAAGPGSGPRQRALALGTVGQSVLTA